MAKLWAKDYQLDKLIEEFTVGIDYLLDDKLIPSDCAASLAHAQQLESIDILSQDDLDALKKGFDEILTLHAEEKFPIKRSDEDGHTAIEGYLSESVGEAGKKIHTGRSRNDQVVTATRVYLRSFLLELLEAGNRLVQTLLKFADTHSNMPMPGRTHTQIAMPSSVGLWAGAYAEQIQDDLALVDSIYTLVDQWPLGAAASYGVPLPLNREMTAGLLGFSRVQNNVLYANNSRGKIESMALDAFDQIGITLSKAAQDLILFSLPELGYFSLPDALCTGSSIMPQKKNPDGLELMRAKSGTLSAYAVQMKNIIRSQVSGYNRDFQETKEPLLRGCELVLSCVRVMELTFSELKVNKENLLKAFTPEIYATDVALEMVAAGKSFRDAYKEVGLSLEKLGTRDAMESIKSRTYPGTTGNLNLEPAVKRSNDLETSVSSRKKAISDKLQALMGRDSVL